MRVTSNVVLLALMSQGLSTLALPVNYGETSDLATREAEEVEARDLDFELEARFIEEMELDARDLDELTEFLEARGLDELDLRSLSEEDILELEARGLLDTVTGYAKNTYNSISSKIRSAPGAADIAGGAHAVKEGFKTLGNADKLLSL
ncbi:hypothetical protein DFP72DRAFT_1137963 [Ephemerocybe angulata]|uniref:Uncharacterized protein n=1 Tax=Ephemerocybe angulata TaxID=980116 RepID=A0A8H6HT81_9AGAR|nr:hypothetical protein DFP72DRAFT_1137963 [Tulosesus angulatus]